jgi:hypothetical protein
MNAKAELVHAPSPRPNVGAGRRAGRLGRKAKADDGEDFVEAFQNAGGDAGSLRARLRISRSALSVSSSSDA